MNVRVALMFMVFLLAAAARGGTVSGVVRDEQGAALPGAQVTLATNTTTSDDEGKYRFLSVPAGAYPLQVSLSGFKAGPSATVSVTAAAPDATMDLTLSKAAPHPEFEASGIRGLIDPGGYSASSNAAAASGLIEGIADIERTGNDPAAKDKLRVSCSLAPALKKAAQEKPEDVEANLRLSDFYLDHGQAAKTIPLLEHMQHLDPRVPNRLAEAYLEAGQFDSAETLLTQPSATPAGTEKLRLLARAREGKGKFTAAAADYQAAAQQDPTEANVFGVGYELVLAGKPNLAQGAFQSGLQRYPRSAELLIGLGSAQFLQGHSPDSIPTLLRAAELNPADPRPYPFLAQASAASPVDSVRVREAFERFLNAAPHDPRAWYDSALNLQQQHAADEANDRRIEALLKQAILLDPGMAEAHFQLGVLYSNRREYQTAVQELETAVRLAPSLREAHYRLALAYRETGHKDLAAKEMQRFEAEPAEGNTDRFISVFSAPKSGVKQQNLCPGDSP